MLSCHESWSHILFNDHFHNFQKRVMVFITSHKYFTPFSQIQRVSTGHPSNEIFSSPITLNIGRRRHFRFSIFYEKYQMSQNLKWICVLNNYQKLIDNTLYANKVYHICMFFIIKRSKCFVIINVKGFNNPSFAQYAR